MLRRMLRRRSVQIALGVTALVAAMVGTSVLRYHLENRGDPLQQNVATWARNHGMGAIVDRLELWLHSDPPSTDPATELAIADNTETTIPGADSNDERFWMPAAIVAPIAPPLDNEGLWSPFLTLRGETLVWATSVRPLAEFGSVTASAAAWDPASFRAALYNGEEIPAGGPWTNYRRVSGEARKSLLITFNGGFRFEHGPGGYRTEGRTVEPLKEGYATLGIDTAGRLRLGVWGEDIVDDGSWVSLRQNLPPVVRGGVSVYRNYKGVNWGEDYDDKTYVTRSGVCTVASGGEPDKMLFVTAGPVNIKGLADTMLLFGCDTGMELDINGNWPHFAKYANFGQTKREGRVLDKRMTNRDRHVNASKKDFFALFDPATLPPGLVK